jgi:hypothetical protein
METKSRPMQHKEKKKTESFFFPHGLETDNLKQQNILKQQRKGLSFSIFWIICAKMIKKPRDMTVVDIVFYLKIYKKLFLILTH